MYVYCVYTECLRHRNTWRNEISINSWKSVCVTVERNKVLERSHSIAEATEAQTLVSWFLLVNIADMENPSWLVAQQKQKKNDDDDLSQCSPISSKSFWIDHQSPEGSIGRSVGRSVNWTRPSHHVKQRILLLAMKLRLLVVRKRFASRGVKFGYCFEIDSLFFHFKFFFKRK